MGIKSIVIIPAYNEEKSIVKTVQDICEHAPEFDYVVVNNTVEQAVADVLAIMQAEACRAQRVTLH